MTQEVIVLSIFLISVTYVIYSLIKYFFAGKNQKLNSCNLGCCTHKIIKKNTDEMLHHA